METEATTATVASAGKGAGYRPLEGMVALVSGGSRGLGRLLSARLANAGAAVTLAEETRPHGVSVFSVDPGLLPIGLGEAALRSRAGQQTPEGRVYGWIRDQFAAGRGTDPEEAARLILALASGHADRLSGRHLGVTEDLGAVLARIDQIQRDDSYTLRWRT